MRTSLVISATILLIAAAYLAIQNHASTPSSSSSLKPPSSQSPSPKSRRSTPPQNSLHYLQSLATLDYSQAPTFAQVEARVAKLSSSEIFDLLQNLDSSAKFAIWLRSALWAELGRRNHPDALPLLIAEASDTSFSINARDQSAFAFFRGRMDSFQDFESLRSQLIPELNHFTDQDVTSDWRRHTIKALFKKLATFDLTATWDIVKQTDSDEHSDTPHSLRFTFGDNQSPLIGFFKSLNSEELVQSYLSDWQTVVETPEYIRRANEYLHPTPNADEIRSTFTIFRLAPDKEHLIHHHLASLARFNPQASLDWITAHQSDPNRPDYNRISQMWNTFANEHPNEAFHHLSSNTLSDDNTDLAIALGTRDFSLIPDIIQTLSNDSIQGRVINRLTSRAFSLATIDNFPTPEGPNRIYDYQQRRDSLLEAIDNSLLPDNLKQNHRDEVEQDFSSRIE